MTGGALGRTPYHIMSSLLLLRVPLRKFPYFVDDIGLL